VKHSQQNPFVLSVASVREDLMLLVIPAKAGIQCLSSYLISDKVQPMPHRSP
jgi:hypothetical protein